MPPSTTPAFRASLLKPADATSEEFDRVNAINLKSVWLCMKYELLQMRKQESGAIVNNSSIGGLIGIPGRAIYHATKHGVIGLTKSAAFEYAARGIRINAICPGAIDTPMVAMIAKEPETMKDITKEQPIGRLGKREEVASAYGYAARARVSSSGTRSLSTGDTRLISFEINDPDQGVDYAPCHREALARKIAAAETTARRKERSGRYGRSQLRRGVRVCRPRGNQLEGLERKSLQAGYQG
jgi:hypothetical protein